MPKTSVLMVCMGNICRSPMAEGILRRELEAAGLTAQVHVDSAGTHAYHVGESPDGRAQAAARRRGADLSRQRGRKVADTDFAAFDYILAMDGHNYQKLIERAPREAHGKIRKLLSFSKKFPNLDVPDPYYGGPQGFEANLDMIEDAVKHLVAELAQRASA